MKISVSSLVPFKQNYDCNNNTVKINTNAESKNYSNTKLMSYPTNYYLPISFGKKLNNSELVDKIGLENFPSPKIAEIFVSQPDKSLWEVHKEYYAPLLDCETLDEAKELYPEFEDVVDAKDINLEKFKSNHILRRIASGEVQETSLNSLSLDLLKKQYAEVKSTKKKESYFNLTKEPVNKLFEVLNIKKMNRGYSYILAGSNPDFKTLIGNISKENWAQDDGTRRLQASETAKEVLFTPEARSNFLASVRSDDFRDQQRQISYEKWANDDGTLLAKVTHTASTVLQSPEVKEKIRQTTQTDEHRELIKLIMLDRWANDDGTMRENSRRVASTVLQSEESRQKQKEAMQTDEYREKQRTNTLNRWANDDGTMRENSRRIASTILQTQEVRDKVNQKVQSDEYRLARILAYQRHPEITSKMKEIADEFPMLGEIIQKEADGSATETEKRLHQIYWKKCQEAMPGYSKIIGDEYHNILVEWGLKDK